MYLHDTKEFNGVRTRIQRLSNYRIVGGWIDGARGNELIVRSDPIPDIKVAERFYIEIHGTSRRLAGSYEFLRSEDTVASPNGPCVYVFRSVGELKHISKSENYRRQVGSIRARLETDDAIIDVTVIDVGAEGLGILCDEEVKTWSKIKVYVSSPLGPIRLNGEVRSCANLESQYRIGVLTQPFDGVEEQKWSIFLNSFGAK